MIKFLFDKQWYDTWDQGMTYYRNIYFVVFPGVPILAMLYLYFFTSEPHCARWALPTAQLAHYPMNFELTIEILPLNGTILETKKKFQRKLIADPLACVVCFDILFLS